jgi:hypothetical protein
MDKPVLYSIGTSCFGCLLWVGVLVWLITCHPRALAVGILILFACYIFLAMLHSLAMALKVK